MKFKLASSLIFIQLINVTSRVKATIKVHGGVYRNKDLKYIPESRELIMRRRI